MIYDALDGVVHGMRGGVGRVGTDGGPHGEFRGRVAAAVER